MLRGEISLSNLLSWVALNWLEIWAAFLQSALRSVRSESRSASWIGQIRQDDSAYFRSHPTM